VSVPYNTARFDALVIALESATAGVPALSESARNAADMARVEKAEALRLSPLTSSPQNMSELVVALAAEHARLLDDPKHNPNHEWQCRAALTAARRAVATETRAAAMRAEVDRKAAELRPLQALVEACRRYVAEGVKGMA
jgi:hypothetical protein